MTPYQPSDRPFSGLIRPSTAYYRVSTPKQGRSGLGLDAQREAVRAHCRAAGLTLMQEVTEIETGTKKRTRPVLARALTHCRLTGSVLLIAKLDRLARNVHFVSGLMESGVDFVALDCPTANRFTIHVLAAVAEHEAMLISTRTKAALKAAKARGVVLGCPRQGIKNIRDHDGRELGTARVKALAQERADRLADVLVDIGSAKSLHEISRELNRRGIRTARGGRWHAATVARVKDRLASGTPVPVRCPEVRLDKGAIHPADGPELIEAAA